MGVRRTGHSETTDKKDTAMSMLGSRRFLPLFLVQFFGALNDNVFKNAFVMLVTYQTASDMGWNTATAVNVIMILLIAPILLFSGLAGQMADRFKKSRMVRWTKVAEIAIMGLAVYGFWAHEPMLLFGVVFLTGVQIAFFGPLKYSILPSHLKTRELLAGSAVFEAATFVAILVGTGLGGLAIEQVSGQVMQAAWLPWVLMALALAGWFVSLFIPSAKSQGESFPISWNPWISTAEILRSARPQVGIWRSMLGISWFWAVGAVWLAFIPPYVAEELGADKTVASLFLTLFSLGIGLGALLCQALLRGEISAKFTPLAGLGISALSLLFVAVAPTGDGEVFAIGSVRGVVMGGCLAGIALCGGVFSVPLYTILQAWSEPSRCSRNIAANNILNALFMVAANGTVALLSLAGWSGLQVLVLLAVLNIGVSLYIIRIIPESVLHTVLRWVLRLLFRVQVRGIENYQAARQRKVIIANHVSYLDAVLLTAFLPELPTFAIDTKIAQSWWIQPFLWMVRVYPVNPANPMAIKSLTKLVKEAVPVVIFPEGRLTVTGGVMKVYQGPGLMAIRGDADIVPVQLDGVHHTYFSYLKNKMKQSLFPQITLTVLPPVQLEKPEGSAREARGQVVTKIYDLLTDMAVATAPAEQTLFDALLWNSRWHGASFEVLNDPSFSPLTYRALIARSLALAPRLVEGVEAGGTVGLMLPNSTVAVAAFFGVQAACRVAALLNFSTGSKNLLSACNTARIRVVWTSERFIREGKLQKVVEALAGAGVEIRYLEKLRATSGVADALRLCVGSIAPSLVWKIVSSQRRRHCQTAGGEWSRTPAVILFTSGSSGTPKAVVLSHRNLLFNVRQLLARVDMNRQDRVFNCLPIFHSFGLTGGTLAPLLGGVPVFMYPSPLHYGVIPELVYQTGSTVLFGTNTFLNGYSKKAHPYDFHTVRSVYAGAEKVKESTKKTWSEVFGVRVLEGYGSTECSPAICMNTAMFNQAGTVGRFLPGIEYKLETVPGIEQGGKLWVRGPNIMMGYYLPEEPGKLVPPPEGWYDTGDIVEVTTEGFVKILGRMKRFAKVAGEMVSLTAVEELASAVWPGVLSAALSVPHPKKGEDIVLVTEKVEPRREDLLAYASKNGIPELFVPRTIIQSAIPVLGTGKPDYVTLQASYAASREESV